MQKLLLAFMPKSALKILRMLRFIVLVTIEPLDYICRLINGKRDFPPVYLRCRTGPLGSFEGSGAEFNAYLKLICKLLPGETLLDIGCGCGLMVLNLTGSSNLAEYLGQSGKYLGIDVHKASIKWCQRKISRKYPNCAFSHMDVRNKAYNPHGRHAADNYVFCFEDSTCDVVLLKSVFTHMLPSAVENYLREIRRLLSDRGRCLATFFLLNKEQEKLAQEGSNRLDFKFGDKTVRYIRKDWPELVVAYEEEFIMNLLAEIGLVLDEPIKYGTWSGRQNGISFQDMVTFRRARNFG